MYYSNLEMHVLEAGRAHLWQISITDQFLFPVVSLYASGRDSVFMSKDRESLNRLGFHGDVTANARTSGWLD